MDLRANAIITAVDRFSGPVGRMAGALNAIHSRAGSLASVGQRVGGAFDKVGGRIHAAAEGLRSVGSNLGNKAALGLGVVIWRTQEFERRLLGAQMAAMAANDEMGNLRQINDLTRLAAEADELKHKALDLSRSLGFSPTGLMQAGEAAAKLGVSLERADAVMRNAAIWNMAESQFAPAAGAEFLGKLGTMFRAPEDARAYGDWIKAQADKIATVAAATPTDLATFSEGLRQFAGAFSVAGGTIDQAAALIGTATAMGQADIESGTAIKMGLVRLVSPTLGHVAALNNAGIDRSKYLQMQGADPRRAINQLVQLFPGYIDKKNKRSIFEQLERAAKSGTMSDPDFIGKIAGKINKLTGGKETIDDTALKVLNALVTSGGEVKYYDYLRDLAEMTQQGKLSDAAFIEAFTKFHYSRMKALLSRPELLDKYLGLAQSSTGRGQDTRAAAYLQSAFGRWEASIASLDRAMVRLRESDGVNRLVDHFASLMNGIASLPPAAIEVMGGLAAGMLALGAVGWAAGGISALAKAMPQLAFGFGALARSPLALGLLGSAGIAYAYRDELAKLWNDADKANEAAHIDSPMYRKALKAQEGKQSLGEWLSSWWDSGGKPSRLDFGQGGLVGSSPVPREPMGGPLIRDLPPLDVTGKVQADVNGTVDGKVRVEVDVKVEGGGSVTDKRVSGGEVRGQLRTGKSMPDVVAP